MPNVSEQDDQPVAAVLSTLLHAWRYCATVIMDQRCAPSASPSPDLHDTIPTLARTRVGVGRRGGEKGGRGAQQANLILRP